MKPLVIYIDPTIEHARLDALREKGHSILSLQLDPAPDLILSPAAHAWHPVMWETAAYLDAALKAVRVRRKGSK